MSCFAIAPISHDHHSIIDAIKPFNGAPIAMSQRTDAVVVSTIGIDTGKNTLHLVGLGWMTRGQLFCVRGLVAAG